MVIYLDLIFFENFGMNLAIIFSEAICLNSFNKFLRKFVGATVGSLFYIITLFYPFASYFQLLVSFFVVKVSFGSHSIKKLFKEVLLFYFISFLFGGLSFAFVSFFNNGNINIMGGILISNFSFFELFLCGIISAFFVIGFLRKKCKHVFKNLIIQFNQKVCKVRVLLDTGNLLREPYTDKPVIIVEKGAVKSIIDVDFNFSECISGEKNLPEGMIIIPYKSIGNSSSYLIGFRPDSMWIEDDEKCLVSDAVIGICEEKLSSTNLYGGIFGLDILG